jgi:hypothetical protein
MNLIHTTRPFKNLPMYTTLVVRTLRRVLIFCALINSLTQSRAEGIKQVAPASTDVTLLMTNDLNYGNFAAYNSVAASRLHINIANPSTEQVHLGLSQMADATGALTTTTYYVRIKDPLGNIVYGPQAINNTNANANTWALATAGPSTVVGASGYVPFTYTPAVGAPAGDYYIEFSNIGTLRLLHAQYLRQSMDVYGQKNGLSERLLSMLLTLLMDNTTALLMALFIPILMMVLSIN